MWFQTDRRGPDRSKVDLERRLGWASVHGRQSLVLERAGDNLFVRIYSVSPVDDAARRQGISETLCARRMSHHAARFVRLEPSDFWNLGFTRRRRPADVQTGEEMQDHGRRRELRIDPHEGSDGDSATRLLLDLALQRGNEVFSFLNLAPWHLPPASRHANKKDAPGVVANTTNDCGDVGGVVGHAQRTLSRPGSSRRLGERSRMTPERDKQSAS